MTLAGFFFYLFAILTTVSGGLVISVRNPVHAVLFLILAFVNAAGLFLLLGAEFIAMILVVVYVGAVAVLFLFVVMMLDVDFATLRAGFMRYLPIGGLIGAVLLTELVMVVGAWTTSPESVNLIGTPMAEGVSNTQALGQVLYTKFAFYFELAGLILLVAMIGAIVLTLRHREGVRRQDIGKQVNRRQEDSMEVKQVEVGKGIL
ncbi:MAG: NADH-quinone oxidoreductase subunit J [Alphaproteobacteria bacterium]